jgi:PIN domain nuclease of toxin-antitoxin system
MILIDTCVLLWLAADPSAISEKAAELIRDPSEELFVSAISAFEVGQKAAARKLFLPCPVDKWFAAMVERRGLREIPVSGAIAARATLLPAIHRDPFDRVLIATAHQQQLTILTPDQTIAKYPGVLTVW